MKLFLNMDDSVTFPYLDFESQEKPKRGCRSTLSRRHVRFIKPEFGFIVSVPDFPNPTQMRSLLLPPFPL